MPRQHKRDPSKQSGWDALASWYDGWMSADGSDHHRKLAIPAVLSLLDLHAGEQVLDIGAGQGVLAAYVAETGARYTGIEISTRLLALAKQRHGGKHARFLLGDARHLDRTAAISGGQFDAAVFLLSIQDMNPLEDVLHSAAWALREGGRLVILMTHPCFRIPRQSGWGYDHDRNLRFRRVDGYLKPLAVPMKAYSQRRDGVSISFHRPLNHYINGLGACGLLVDALREICAVEDAETPKPERRANAEIPLFMGLRARKL